MTEILHKHKKIPVSANPVRHAEYPEIEFTQKGLKKLNLDRQAINALVVAFKHAILENRKKKKH